MDANLFLKDFVAPFSGFEAVDFEPRNSITSGLTDTGTVSLSFRGSVEDPFCLTKFAACVEESLSDNCASVNPSVKFQIEPDLKFGDSKLGSVVSMF